MSRNLEQPYATDMEYGVRQELQKPHRQVGNGVDGNIFHLCEVSSLLLVPCYLFLVPCYLFLVTCFLLLIS